MSVNAVENQKNLTSAVIQMLSMRFQDEVPTRGEVEGFVENLISSGAVEYRGDLGAIIEDVLSQFDVKMGAGVSIVGQESDHDEDWVFKIDRTKKGAKVYMDAYEHHLRSEAWHPAVIQSLSDVCTKILGHMGDPRQESFDRRGLVIGHVQSGKTANYMGLIAQAADAGYKFIIVIAGIHNNLRKQTQERIDEGFVGRSSDPDNKRLIGVGLNSDFPHPASITNIYDDFSSGTADRSTWRLNDFNNPIIVVIKKNVSTLRALYSWLKDINAQGRGAEQRISDVPMLMIDDEADNASINTNKEDLDPTATNARIREILGLFDKSSYVGYTATPFANIFINPEAYDKEAYDELFPRDFIYCLDAPTTYFGPDRVFLSEDESDRVLEPILDAEEYIPLSHKKDFEVPDLPPSLYWAINQFLVARTIRILRGQQTKHCSMMVNVSRFVSVQRSVKELISYRIALIENAVQANAKKMPEYAERNQYISDLKEVFESEFEECGVQWETVLSRLPDCFYNQRVLLVNSQSDESLDYKKHEKDGLGLSAIAVGGLSLSRGLTIEGLCVSYMYRNTRMGDTLMQMGRWFGYRPGYEDLCRIHLSPDSIDWYAHISQAAEDLRDQIKQMRRDRLTPKQFGLFVEAHPDRLLITAANKMRAGEQIKMKQNFSGMLRETYLLPMDSEVNHNNEDLIARSWKTGFGGFRVESTRKGWIVRDLPVQKIIDFLSEFRVHEGLADAKLHMTAFLSAVEAKHPCADVLLISKAGGDEDPTAFRLGSQDRRSARRDSDFPDAWHLSKDRVASRGDEQLGLSEAQKEEAKRLAEQDGSKSNEPTDRHFRRVRSKPLLMLHVLCPVGDPNQPDRIPAFGLSFPFGDFDTEVEVVANPVYIKNRRNRIEEFIEEEDLD